MSNEGTRENPNQMISYQKQQRQADKAWNKGEQPRKGKAEDSGKVLSDGAAVTLLTSRLTMIKESTQQVVVEMSPSELLSDVAERVLNSANRIFRDAHNMPPMTGELLIKYFYTALNHRIVTVTSSKLDYELKDWAHDFPLPCIVYSALRMIGKARDSRYNIEFIPASTIFALDGKDTIEMPIEGSDPGLQCCVTKAEFLQCKDYFREMELKGYPVTEALSKDVYGDIHFMAMTNLSVDQKGNKRVGPRSYIDSSPVYAFYRSFFYNQQLARLCENFYVNKYNDMDEMRSILFDILSRRESLPMVTDVLENYRA